MTTKTRDWLFQELQKDDKFVAGRKATGVSTSGGTDEIVLKNPSGSGVVVYVSLAKFTSTTRSTIRFTKNIGIDSDGSSVDVVSTRVNGSPGGNTVTVQANGSYSGGQQQEVEFIPGSGSGSGTAGGSEAGATFLVEPGRNIRFSITNNSGSNTADVLHKLVFHELPEDEV